LTGGALDAAALVLPLAMGVALSPFPVLAAIPIPSGPRAATAGPAVEVATGGVNPKNIAFAAGAAGSIAGARAARALEAAKDFMVDDGQAILAAVFAILGVKFGAEGPAGLFG
jgi:hypothetical protein